MTSSFKIMLRTAQSFSILACFVVLLAASVAVEDQEILNGYFPDRSGDMIFRPKESLPNNITVIFRSGTTSATTTSLKTLEATRFAPLIAHLMGTLSPVNPVTRADFPPSSLFDKPSANLFIAVDALSADLLEQLSGLTFFTTTNMVRLTPTYYPADSVSFLTTLYAGVTPSVHGVVGKSWLKVTGETVFAYEPSEEPQAASIADEWAYAARGTALLLAGSSDRQLAAAVSPNPHRVEPAEAAVAYTYVWNGEAFERLSTSLSSSSSPSSPSFSISHADIEAILRNGQLPLGAGTFRGTVRAVEPDTLEVAVDSAVAATFHLEADEDFAFFAELSLLRQVADYVANAGPGSLVADGVPDFYSFVLAGLRGLQARYGPRSAKVLVAVAMLDAGLAEFVGTLEARYGGRLLTEAVLLDTAQAPVASEVLQAVVAASARYLRDEAGVGEQWPAVYLRSSLGRSQKQEVCAAVAQAVADLGWDVLCPELKLTTPSLPSPSLKAALANSSSTPSYEYSYEEIQVFHVVLWMSIVLVLVLLATWLALHCMDVGEDSIIYRQVHLGRHAHKS